MKRATVRDLRYSFPKVEKMLKRGETIEITKRGKVIGQLAPAQEIDEEPVVWPDFAARQKRIFGDRIIQPSGAELVSRDRDRP